MTKSTRAEIGSARVAYLQGDCSYGCAHSVGRINVGQERALIKPISEHDLRLTVRVNAHTDAWRRRRTINVGRERALNDPRAWPWPSATEKKRSPRPLAAASCRRLAVGSTPGDRGLHSSTLQLNLSRVCHEKTPYTP